MGSVLFVLPMGDKIDALKLSKDAMGIELQALQTQYDDLSELSEKVAASETTRAWLKAAVPAGYQEDTLLLELAQMAEDLNFELNAVNFSDTVDEVNGNKLSVTANFNGTYEDLVAFLQKIETADRLMQVTSLGVQRISTSEIGFSLALEAYYQ